MKHFKETTVGCRREGRIMLAQMVLQLLLERCNIFAAVNNLR